MNHIHTVFWALSLHMFRVRDIFIFRVVGAVVARCMQSKRKRPRCSLSQQQQKKELAAKGALPFHAVLL